MAAGQLTQYGAQQLLALAFGQGGAGAPATWYFGITTAIPNINATGADIGALEPPSASNYSRLAITNNNTNFPTIADAPYILLNPPAGLYWPSTPTLGATADWPICYGWGLCDSLTGGQCWAVGTLSTPVATPSGFCAYLAPGNLSIELSPFFQIATS